MHVLQPICAPGRLQFSTLHLLGLTGWRRQCRSPQPRSSRSVASWISRAVILLGEMRDTWRSARGGAAALSGDEARDSASSPSSSPSFSSSSSSGSSSSLCVVGVRRPPRPVPVAAGFPARPAAPRGCFLAFCFRIVLALGPQVMPGVRLRDCQCDRGSRQIRMPRSLGIKQGGLFT